MSFTGKESEHWKEERKRPSFEMLLQFPFINDLSTFRLLQRFLILAFHACELEQESLTKTLRKDKSADLKYFLFTLFSPRVLSAKLALRCIYWRPGTRQFHAVGRPVLR